jgi:triosephosphate isomerase
MAEKIKRPSVTVFLIGHAEPRPVLGEVNELVRHRRAFTEDLSEARLSA